MCLEPLHHRTCTLLSPLWGHMHRPTRAHGPPPLGGDGHDSRHRRHDSPPWGCEPRLAPPPVHLIFSPVLRCLRQNFSCGPCSLALISRVRGDLGGWPARARPPLWQRALKIQKTGGVGTVRGVDSMWVDTQTLLLLHALRPDLPAYLGELFIFYFALPRDCLASGIPLVCIHPR